VYNRDRRVRTVSFVFSAEKAAQVASFFLKKAPSKSLTRLKLLKLMYLADRESLHRRGFPITGDKAVAMDNGPVLSEVYDLIKGCGPSDSRMDVVLANDPRDGKLSENDLVLLDDTFNQFGNMTARQLSKYTHGLEEWKETHAPGTSKKIELSTIVAAIGKDTEEANRRKQFDQHLSHLFGC